VLSTPPRHARPLREERLLERAQAFAIPFGAGGMRGWRWGSGPAVLLVHSWGGRGAQLCEFVEPLLAQGLSPVTFDAPAHGASRGRRTDFLEYAAGVHATALACGPLAGVIAHSLGAATALLAMRDWGLRAPRLVSVGAFNHCQWFTDAFGLLVGMRPAAVERMRQMFVERYSQRVNWSRLSIADALRQADTRTLLVHDAEDHEVPYPHVLDLRRARPDAALFTTRGLGHRRIVRDAEVIGRAVSFVVG
jgi:pimeloyl-ACP methyl ester carboxylesterase